MPEAPIDPTDLAGYESDAAAIVAFAEARTAHDLRPVAKPVPGVEIHARSRGLEMVTIDHRHLLPAPPRQGGVVELHTPASFVEWVQTHQGEPAEVYADRKNRAITAILNPGNADDPGWCDYRAVVMPAYTPEWDAWRGLHGKFIEQVEFGHFIADWAHTFVAPAALDVADLARDLTILSNARVAAAQNLRTGERRFVFEENDQTVDASGNVLDVPNTFAVRFPIFDGTDPVDLEPSFRFRRVNGTIAMGVHFGDLNGIVRRAFEAIAADIAEGLGIVPFMGCPPGASVVADRVRVD